MSFYLIAELNTKQLRMLQQGDATLEVPHGVEMTNHAGSKILEFFCEESDPEESLKIEKALKNGLDASAIGWN